MECNSLALFPRAKPRRNIVFIVKSSKDKLMLNLFEHNKSNTKSKFQAGSVYGAPGRFNKHTSKYSNKVFMV